MNRIIMLIIGTLIIAGVIIWRKIRPTEPITYKIGYSAPIPARLQHAVYYVRNLEHSRTFYEYIFDLQFSARNHQDSSAAMRITNQNLMFFSFGEMHHDICFVSNPNIHLDNDDWMGFTVRLRADQHLNTIEQRLEQLGVTFTRGRVFPTDPDIGHALFFHDPDGHLIEVLEA